MHACMHAFISTTVHRKVTAKKIARIKRGLAHEGVIREKLPYDIVLVQTSLLKPLVFALIVNNY